MNPSNVDHIKNIYSSSLPGRGYSPLEIIQGSIEFALEKCQQMGMSTAEVQGMFQDFLLYYREN